MAMKSNPSQRMAMKGNPSQRKGEPARWEGERGQRELLGEAEGRRRKETARTLERNPRCLHSVLARNTRCQFVRYPLVLGPLSGSRAVELLELLQGGLHLELLPGGLLHGQLLQCRLLQNGLLQSELLEGGLLEGGLLEGVLLVSVLLV